MLLRNGRKLLKQGRNCSDLIVYICNVPYPYCIKRYKMTQTDLVSTNIRLTPEQREFIHNSEYSLSKLVRTTITKLMENNN